MSFEDDGRLEKLVEINCLLMEAVEASELLDTVLSSVLELFSAEDCSIALLDDATRELAFTTLAGKEFRVPLERGIVAWVVQRGEPAICNDLSLDDRFYPDVDRRTGFESRSMLSAPLKRGDRTIGAIQVLNTARPEGFREADITLLQAFAGLAATAIERARAFGKLSRENAVFREDIDARYRLLVGESPAMQAVVETARMAAATNSTILLLGESGTGKEVLARAIHRWSQRADQPFVALSCAALTPELLESELFGHERGAFTGAVATKKGKFELADGGSLFLDEVGEAAGSIQAKLLRVLQEKEFQRVGGLKDIRSDVRIVAATNRDLRSAIEQGEFREDLYYRLDVVSLRIPPLRERVEDIPVLARAFVEQRCHEMGREPLVVSEGAIRLMQAYAWPGNVRELQNAIERAVVLNRDGELSEEDLPACSPDRSAGGGGPDMSEEMLPLSEAVDAFKRRRIQLALDAEGGNQTRAAERLGLRQANLSRLMKTLEMR